MEKSGWPRCPSRIQLRARKVPTMIFPVSEHPTLCSVQSRQ